MSLLYFGTSVASLAGVWLNIRKNRASFAIWSVTNAIWAVADFTHGLPEQGALHLTYLVLAIHGLSAWRKPEPLASPPDPRAAAAIHPSTTEAHP